MKLRFYIFAKVSTHKILNSQNKVPVKLTCLTALLYFFAIAASDSPRHRLVVKPHVCFKYNCRYWRTWLTQHKVIFFALNLYVKASGIKVGEGGTCSRCHLLQAPPLGGQKIQVPVTFSALKSISFRE